VSIVIGIFFPLQPSEVKGLSISKRTSEPANAEKGEKQKTQKTENNNVFLITHLLLNGVIHSGKGPNQTLAALN
jgi:hypothetical protein